MKLHPTTLMCVGPPKMVWEGSSLKFDLFGTLYVAWLFAHRVDYL